MQNSLSLYIDNMCVCDAGGDKTDMEKCCEIVATKTTVDIKYIDGTSKEDVPATETLMFNPGMADGLRE